jgi:hypothetical protein
MNSYCKTGLRLSHLKTLAPEELNGAEDDSEDEEIATVEGQGSIS